MTVPFDVMRRVRLVLLLSLLSGCASASLEPPGTMPLGVAARYVGAMSWPLAGAHTVTSRFGKRSLRFHEGLDLGAPRGTPVLAAHRGTVVGSGPLLRGYGNMVVVRGEGLLTVYAHNHRNLVEVGDEVRAGEQIAEGQAVAEIG